MGPRGGIPPQTVGAMRRIRLPGPPVPGGVRRRREKIQMTILARGRWATAPSIMQWRLDLRASVQEPPARPAPGGGRFLSRHREGFSAAAHPSISFDSSSPAAVEICSTSFQLAALSTPGSRQRRSDHESWGSGECDGARVPSPNSDRQGADLRPGQGAPGIGSIATRGPAWTSGRGQASASRGITMRSGVVSRSRTDGPRIWQAPCRFMDVAS